MKLKLIILFGQLSIICFGQSSIKPYLIGNSFYYVNENGETITDSFTFLFPVIENVGLGKINDSLFVKIKLPQGTNYDTLTHFEFLPSEEIEYEEKCYSDYSSFYKGIASLQVLFYVDSKKADRSFKELYKVKEIDLFEKYLILSSKQVPLDTINALKLEYLYDNYFLERATISEYKIFEFKGDTIYITDNLTCWDNYNQVLTEIVDGKVKFIDVRGNPLIKSLFDNYTKSIYSQFIIVKVSNKYGLLDEKFNAVLDCQYEGVGEPLYNTIPVMINNKWGLFGLNKKKITENKYDTMIQFSQSELRLVSVRDTFFFIDNSGTELRRK